MNTDKQIHKKKQKMVDRRKIWNRSNKNETEQWTIKSEIQERKKHIWKRRREVEESKRLKAIRSKVMFVHGSLAPLLPAAQRPNQLNQILLSSNLPFLSMEIY